MDEPVYPISEIFDSIQGEGAWAGTRMTFVRLAGCNVGKPWPLDQRPTTFGLAVWAEKCTDWQGCEFVCDTDFRVKERMTPEQLVVAVGGALRVCITGGEPFIHDLWPLISACRTAGKLVHIETSGTRGPVPVASGVWLTVSPKKGYQHSILHSAQEIKILVGQHFNEDEFIAQFSGYFDTKKVFVQPINGEVDIDNVNLQRCISLTKKYPTLRLSIQLHKVIGVH